MLTEVVIFMKQGYISKLSGGCSVASYLLQNTPVREKEKYILYEMLGLGCYGRGHANLERRLEPGREVIILERGCCSV